MNIINMIGVYENQEKSLDNKIVLVNIRFSN